MATFITLLIIFCIIMGMYTHYQDHKEECERIAEIMRRQHPDLAARERSHPSRLEKLDDGNLL
jgi:hypothetical protein